MDFPVLTVLRAMWMYSRLILLVAVCVVAAVLFGCARKHSAQLVVGMELSYPPFEMTDERNQPTGIEVEIARALAERLHRELVIQNTKFEGLIPALQTGKIDLILSAMTATPQRAEAIDFSDAYMHTAICLLVGKNTDIQSGDDLNKPNRRLVVKTATTGSNYAREHLSQARVFQIADEAACVLEVVQGKADAFIYDQMSVYQLQKKNPGTTRAILKPLQRESWAIGIRKKNDALRGEVNAFLTDFKAGRGLENLADKYLHDQQALDEMGQPFTF